MNNFDPGAGWFEVTGRDADAPLPVGGISYHAPDGWHYWVQEEPVPPLPTEPYTVIRVTWNDDEDDRLVDTLVRGEEQWAAVEADQWHTAADLHKRINDFKVLAEPCDLHYSRYDLNKAEERVRRETAKAVLDRVREHVPTYGDRDRMWDIACEFGVEA